jgi:hypothetical protein
MSTKPAIPEWNPEFFDAAYYGQGGRGGFREYDYRSALQQGQLEIKRNLCDRILHSSALFIGCARGYEVAHWRHHGKQAAGVDVSTWAIDNQIPEAEGHCRLYNGWDLSTFADKSFDLVAAFDVLTLVPDDMLEKLSAEMRRVAAKAIVFRTVVKNWRNSARVVDSLDGAWFRYLPLSSWDRIFTEHGDFILESCAMSWNAECFLTFVRVSPDDPRLKHLEADR